MIVDTRGQKILIVEHDRTVLEMLQIRLEVAGYHTLTARTGCLALEVLKAERPGAMVIERHLPEFDGFEVLHALNPRGDKLPFPTLMMGRNLSPEDIQHAVKLGVRDILAKPFSGADFLERVARLLKRPTSHPAAAAPQRALA